MWILEHLKNQSESWKSPGNLFLKKGTNHVLRYTHWSLTGQFGIMESTHNFFFHFCFARTTWNTIGQKPKNVRKLSIYYVWWGAIRSPWNRCIPHVLTMKNKSSTPVSESVSGRIGCACYWCFNKVPLYFWLNIKLKREQLKEWYGIKAYSPSCRLQMGRVKYYKRLWL